MGWTFSHRNKGMTTKEFFKQEFGDCVVDVAPVGWNEVYLACKVPNRGIVGVVCMVKYDHTSYYNFGYKDMEESMGPYLYNCPERILDKLSDLKDLYPSGNYENAEKWRRLCRENIEKKWEERNEKQESTIRVIKDGR